jgi:hypothetical protein
MKRTLRMIFGVIWGAALIASPYCLGIVTGVIGGMFFAHMILSGQYVAAMLEVLSAAVILLAYAILKKK